jgi:hypothetical protein
MSFDCVAGPPSQALRLCDLRDACGRGARCSGAPTQVDSAWPACEAHVGQTAGEALRGDCRRRPAASGPAALHAAAAGQSCPPALCAFATLRLVMKSSDCTDFSYLERLADMPSYLDLTERPPKVLSEHCLFWLVVPSSQSSYCVV